jgi:hypothetical protein
MRRRNRFRNPRFQRRLGLGLIAAGGLLAAFGAARRADGGSNATYYLDVLGIVVALAGAAIETMSAQLFLAADQQSARRRAIALLVGGLVTGFAGCVLASVVAEDDNALVSATGLFALVAGCGAGLAGFLSLIWFFGGDYAAKRIERLSEEEW